MTELENVLYALHCRAIDCPATCAECAYYVPKWSCCNLRQIMRDSLDLLKAQEPRVMTLEEVLNADDFVWAEIYTPHKWSWCVIHVKIFPVVGNDEIVKIEEDCGTGWTKSKADYGKRGFLDGGWRCWTARPTEEQRKVVEGMSDAEKREKVIFAIENCLATDSVTECRKTECPFISCRESCLEWLLRSALALLKAQEPRVMTLEEAREAIRDGGEDVIFWEEKTSRNPHILGIGLRMINSEEIDFQNNDYVTFDALDDQKIVSEYGSLFRLWTSRPSPEQMANTPWKGDAE